MRRWVLGGLLALAGVGAFAPRAGADDALWRTFRGRVAFSDIALAPESSFDSPAAMASALRRIQRTSAEQVAGFWRLHLIAFLDRPAAGALLLRATDVTDPRAPREVRVFEAPAERGAKALRLDDFVVTEGMGFKRGASYEITIEAAPETAGEAAETNSRVEPASSARRATSREGSGTLPGFPREKAGKADVYAKGVITLR